VLGVVLGEEDGFELKLGRPLGDALGVVLGAEDGLEEGCTLGDAVGSM
jgi:hypothetical protein